MSDPLLSAQRRVDCLAAQRRPVVFPLHRDSDGAGDAERLAVVLLGHDTWRETKGRREAVKKKEGRTGQTFPSPHSLFMQQYHLLPTCCGKRRAWGGVEEKSGLKGRRQRWLDVSRLEGV